MTSESDMGTDERDQERWMVDYEHEEGEPQHAVLSWVTPDDPTTRLPEVGEKAEAEREALKEALVLVAMAHDGSLIDDWTFEEERYTPFDRGLLDAVRVGQTEDYEAHLTEKGRESIRAALGASVSKEETS